MSKHKRVPVRGVQAPCERVYDLCDTTYCHSIPNHRDFHGVDLVRDVFVETGTRQAFTTKSAVAAGYREIHTIDIDFRAYEDAHVHFVCNPAVYVHWGNSPDVLKRILNPSWYATFWLDAHDEVQTPLLEELEVILSVPWQRLPLILIDDTYWFGLRQWPSEQQIAAMLDPTHDLEIRGKVLFAFPRGK